MKPRISELLWPLGVGMLTGWVVLDLFLLAVLKSGGRIESWHVVVWIAATFGGMWVGIGGRREVERGKRAEGGRRMTEDGGRRAEDGGRWAVGGGRWWLTGVWRPASALGRRLRGALCLTVVGLALPIFFGWMMGHFTDFSWDGMTSRGLTVQTLMAGGKPNNEPCLGHVAAGFLAKITGSWQSGKGINLTLIWISFCFAFGGLRNLGFTSISCWLLSALAALNPVAIYQISSFQIDGHVASLFTCLAFACLGLWGSTAAWSSGWLGVLAAFAGLCLSKTSGIFYAITVVLLFLASFFYLQKHQRKVKLAWTLVLFSAGVGFLWLYVASGLGQISWDRLTRVSNIRTPGYGVGDGAARVKEYLNLSRPALFAASAFSMTEGSPEKINLKPPFWTTRREIRIFEDLFPDPRAGGFGPFYSTAFLLAGLGCLGLVAAGRWKYWPGWFLVIAAFGSSYFSQIWWARWTPQNWLLVVGMLMPLVAYGFGSSRKGGSKSLGVEELKGLEGGGLDGEKVQRIGGWKGTWVRTFAVLGMIAAFLNVGIIALYYGIGMVRQERILDSQMHVAAQLPQPLPIYLPSEGNGFFLASKIWLKEKGIVFREVPEKVPKPRMKLNRTNTFFPLPENWRSLLRRPEDEAVLRERRLVED